MLTCCHLKSILKNDKAHFFDRTKEEGENSMKKIISVFLVCVMLLSTLAVSAFAMTATSEWHSTYSERTKTSGKMLVTPGKDETVLNFTWFSSSIKESFSYAPSSDEKNIKTVTVTGIGTGSGMKHVLTLDSLKAGSYIYSYTADGKTYDGKSFTVNDTAGDYSVMYCTDPQLGRSGKKNSDTSIANDAYGWEKTVVEAVGKGAGLIVSGGDQINEGLSQKQMNVLLSVDKLDSVPFVGAVGNHDFYSALYPRYFSSIGEIGSGNDRYFMHGDALFIIIDATILNNPAHEATIKTAVEKYPNAKWRIAVLHMSAYTIDEGEWSNTLFGKSLTPLFDKYQLDLVLSGHDHAYARTPATKDGKAASDGTVYLQAGSASGGKCGHFSAEGKSYIEFAYDVPSGDASYSMLYFSGDKLTVKSFITGNETPFDVFTLSARSERSASTSFAFFANIIQIFIKLINRFANLFA